MTFALPAHGAPNWDTPNNANLQYLKDTAEAAETPAGATSKANAAYAAAAAHADSGDTAVTASLNAHATNTSNPHAVTKAQVGLGNADNTSDAAKPISTAAATALAGKLDSSTAAVDTAVSGRVGDSTSATRAALVATRAEVYDDFTGRADGAFAAGYTTRSGHGITLFNLGGTDYSTASGALTHPITAGTTAAYLGVQLPAPVRDTRAEVKWTNNSQPSDELAVLIVSASRFTVAGFANAGAHLLIYRDHWTYQTYAAGVGPTTRASGTFTALPFGVWHRFSLTWDGASPTFNLPDGSSVPIAADTNITNSWGAHATYESFSTGNMNPVSIRGFSASSTVALPTTTPATGYGRHVKVPVAAATSITGGFTTIDTLTIVVPPTRVLAVTAMEYVDQPAAGNLYSQIDIGGNATSTQVQLLMSGETCNRSLTIVAILDLSAFTPGTSQTLNVKLFSTGAGALCRVNDGEHRRQSIIAIPVASGTFV